MAPADSYPPLPSVGAHLEVVEALRRLGRGEIAADVAYGELRRAVETYLWDGASERHGAIVGVLVAEAAVPPARWSEQNLKDLARTWQSLGDAAPSPVAADRAVLQLNESLLLMNAGDDAIGEGYAKLFDEKLARLFPPRGYLPSFRED